MSLVLLTKGAFSQGLISPGKQFEPMPDQAGYQCKLLAVPPDGPHSFRLCSFSGLAAR